jgi:spermidine synthase
MGLSFGFLQRSVQTDLSGLGRRVGWLAANIAGAVAGAVTTGFVLLDYLGTAGTLRVLVLAGGIFLWLATPPRMVARMAAVAVVACAAAVVPPPSDLWPRLHGALSDVTVFAEDSTRFSVRCRCCCIPRPRGSR